MKRLVSANISKRFGAFVLDAFMMIILGTLLYSGFAQIFIKTPAFSEATKIMNEILVETHLYTYDKEDPNVVIIVEEKEYDVSVEKYYLDYLKDEDAYHLKMEESNLFNYVDGDYVKKDSVKEEDVKTFYEEVITDAIIKVKNGEEYLFCYQVSMNYVFYNFFLSFLLSTKILILLICVALVLSIKTSTPLICAKPNSAISYLSGKLVDKRFSDVEYSIPITLSAEPQKPASVI